ncbi:GNAT family N-acetyltransferase [Cutibacterium sp. WCA-380-WT-3A]|uniref:GNAT family N-acetyltransferase n=1 Tax=Cutibacterium porci TaxID=2605781 RepID=A0A7K0J3W0_9ACTN|nr:GNAT family N-acetyltransferase [Cutibacterium porci]MSS44616.1 GNAT family N-acetyltransferase [Cutibacterium porci]
MIVRHYEPGDAAAIVQLYNTHSDAPNPVDGGITTEQFQQEIDERGSMTFLVAEEDGAIVGTFGAFRTNGRHTMAEDEVFADMFYVAPSHRMSTVSGQLIAEVISECLAQGTDVIRLTVNPTNTPALKTYRKVGCACLGATDACEDGNIELHNFMPMIIRACIRKLDPETLRTLGEMTSFGCLTEGRPLDLSHDVTVVNGRKLISQAIEIGHTRIEAVVDTTSHTVVEATLSNPAWPQPKRIIESSPAPDEPGTPSPDSVRLLHDVLEVAFHSGVIEISTANHWGPVLAMSWPSPSAHRAHGWRQGPATSYRSEIHDNRLVVRDDQGVTCTTTITDGRVTIRMDGTPGTQLRTYQWCNLRQAYLTADTTPGSFELASSGLGVALRDASQIPTAGVPVNANSPITWSQGNISVKLDPCGRTTLIHSTLVDRRIVLDETGTACLTMIIRSAPGPAEDVTTDLPPHLADTDKVVLKPAAGGMTTWRVGTTKVLKSPWPHVRSLGSNPHWRAGLWVSQEPDRHNRRHGMGWGSDGREWSLADDTMTSTDGVLSWSLSGAADTGWTIDVTTSDMHGETVVWLTPNCATDECIRTSDHGVTTRLATATSWQRWTTRCAIPLSQGGWLLIEPDHDLTDSPEILLRSIRGQLLVGCVARARSGSATWRFAITSQLPTHNPRSNDYTCVA